MACRSVLILASRRAVETVVGIEKSSSQKQYGNMPYKSTFATMNQKNLTRKELALSVTNKLGISQRNAAEIVDTVFATLKNTLVGGESIKLVQFGSLIVRDKSPRRGRNPKTGKSMLITKRQMVNFRPSRQLRERLNG